MKQSEWKFWKSLCERNGSTGFRVRLEVGKDAFEEIGLVCDNDNMVNEVKAVIDRMLTPEPSEAK